MSFAKLQLRGLQSGSSAGSVTDNPGLHFVCSIPSAGVICGVCAANTAGDAPVLLYNLSRTREHMPFVVIKASDSRTKLFGVDLCAGSEWNALASVEAGLRSAVNALETDVQPQPFDLSQCTTPSEGSWPPKEVLFAGDAAGAMFTRRPANISMNSVLASPRGACYCHPDNGGECAPLLPTVSSVRGEGRIYRAQRGDFGLDITEEDVGS